jgi:N6-adenosine-specific RNA methylase IME4
MSENSSLILFERASQMLAEANTIQKAKELKDLALTAAEWAKRKGMGERAVQYARSYALDAMRRLGELLNDTPKAKGGEYYHKNPTGNIDVPVPPTIAELGITKRESADARKLSEIDDNTFEDIKANKTTITKVKRKLKQKEIKEMEWPKGKYRIVYADPPWGYSNTMPGYMGVQDEHYSTMSTDKICSLPVKELSFKNSVLFLWATSPILEESFYVIGAWGFKYKASFVWDKIDHVMGHYNSVRHEFLLLAIRGSCPPDVPKLFDSVQSIKRGKHSEKPEEFRNIIDTIYPEGPRIELFSRTKHNGWDFYGNQI